MANEAVEKVILQDACIDMTVTNSPAIEKGTLLVISGDKIVAANPATITGDQIFGGIAAREKVAADGRTQLAVKTKGIFDLVCGEAMGAGHIVRLSGGNIVRKATEASLVSGQVVGKLLEAASAMETCEVLVGEI